MYEYIRNSDNKVASIPSAKFMLPIKPVVKITGNFPSDFPTFASCQFGNYSVGHLQRYSLRWRSQAAWSKA
jgi:hypothetical protein